MASIAEHREHLGEQLTFWRSAAGAPVLYLHGVPTSSDDWLPFLERTGGFAPDLPGFGRSGKPGHGDYTMEGLAGFVGAFADHVGLERVRLVVHDWGAVGLLWAMRHPERVERIVVINAVPFLPGYRWHWIARLWRRRALGEVFIGLGTRWGFRQLSRQATASGKPLPREFVAQTWPHFDQGTQRAILRLYRSADEDRLAAAGAQLGALTAPALVVWGAADPYIDAAFGRAYAQRLPSAELVELPRAGHWPWLDDSEVVRKVTGFLLR